MASNRGFRRWPDWDEFTHDQQRAVALWGLFWGVCFGVIGFCLGALFL